MVMWLRWLMVAKQAPVGELVHATGAPGIAAHDPPYGEDRPADHPELAHGLDPVRRAARVIAAAGREIRGDDRPVEVERQQEGLAQQASGGGAGGRAFHVLRRPDP